MATVVDSASQLSTMDRVQNAIDDYFDLTNSSWGMTALKVISYMTLVIPALMFAIKTFLECISKSCGMSQPVALIAPIPLPANLQAVIDASPIFNGYQIGIGTPWEGRLTLTGAQVRPANLLYQALLGPGCTTMPGSGQLFRFTVPFAQVRQAVQQLAHQQGSLNVTARGIGNLEQLYGPGVFSISGQELQETFESQRIYCAPLLPVRFYQGLKIAMAIDGIVELPNTVLHRLQGACGEFLQAARANPRAYGFQSDEHFRQIMQLTMYQLGSLVVKTEDFRILIDQNGAIRNRRVGDPDAIRLINACGIRNIYQTGNTSIQNRTILTQMFGTALASAREGFLVMPAVGMGVWGGDPAVYWPALLDAVVNMDVPLERIFINPGHQQHRGMNGNEFQQYLNQYLGRYADNPRALANLQKIVNLFDKRTDIVHFSQNLKEAFPDRVVSLFNASDPDVTLGYHVGEYVNNLGHASTTEENFTALGTNGLCFEGITEIHSQARAAHIQQVLIGG